MRLPVATGDLVADQRIAGGAVGNTQQCFGQAHQRHAFLAGQREFLDQSFNAATAALAAQLPDKVGRHGVDLFQVGHARLTQQQRHAFRFGAAIRGGNRGAQHGLRLHVLAKLVERRGRRGGRVARLVVGTGIHAQMRHLGGQVAPLDFVQIRKNGLLMQPVGRAVELVGGGLEAVAQCVINFDAEGRAGHKRLLPVAWQRCYWVRTKPSMGRTVC
ncbi:hypothetical protein D3C73_1172950 [compost metagenome]